jgi:hypothetical protein
MQGEWVDECVEDADVWFRMQLAASALHAGEGVIWVG